MPRVSAIACVDADMGLGYEGKLLYKNSVDMAFFSGFTQNKLVVGGRKTMEGIKSLPNRGMVCLTRDIDNIKDPSKYLSISTVENFEHVKELAEYVDCDIAIIGGEQIYAKMSDIVDDLYLTVLNIDKVNKMYADTHFPISYYDHLDISEVVFKNEHLTIYHSFKK